MIQEQICKKVLLMGIDYHSKGGISQVESLYKDIYTPFYFIRTSSLETFQFNKILIFVTALINLIYYILFRKIKIVHLHSASGNSFKRKSIIIKVAKALGAKVVMHMHGGKFKMYYELNTSFVKPVLDRCDAIVAISEYWQDYFISQLGYQNTFHIPNIVATPHKYPKSESNNYFTFYFLGKICDDKGIFDLMEVVKNNKNVLEGNVRFLIGGNGEVERLIKEIDEAKLSIIVDYIGWVSGADKIELMNKSDAFILPSYIEGMPISILEAMSYSLPVISTNVGGIPDIMQDGINGYMIKPGDKEGLLNAILSLSQDRRKAIAMGERGRQKVKEHLPSQVALKLEELYLDILEK